MELSQSRAVIQREHDGVPWELQPDFAPLLDEVLIRLGKEFAASGKGDLFERLQQFLVEGTGGKTYAEIGREASISEEAIKKAVQRMRCRYHQLFREEIANTVGTVEEVEDELRHLCAVLGS